MTDVYLRPVSTDVILWDPTVLGGGVRESVFSSAGAGMALAAGALWFVAQALAAGSSTVAGVSESPDTARAMVEFPQVTVLPGAVRTRRPSYVGILPSREVGVRR